MCSKSKIAVLYFSRKAQDEAVQKQWLGRRGNTRDRAIATALIAHSLKAVEASGLPVFHYHKDNQSGDTFGQRLANAYEELFDQGYDAVIAVGNDTPELSAINWQEAISPLEAGRCVLGASLRGGAYFIGLTAAAFRKNVFQNLSWQTKGLFRELQAYCTCEEEQPHLLSALRDVNTFHDLLALARVKGVARGLCRFITRILLQKNSEFPFSFRDTLSSFASPVSLRGPPAIA